MNNFLGPCVFYADFRQGSILEYALFRTETPQISTISQRRATIPPRRRSAKCVNYSKLQQRSRMRQKDADFTALNFWTGASTGRGERCRQIDGNGAKMAGAARVGRWRSKSKAGGKYLLNKGGQNSEAINKNFPKYLKMLKNGNAVFIGDFRRFAAGDVSYLRRISYVL